MNLYSNFSLEGFTLVPVWMIQDALVLLAAVAVLVFIVRNEEHPFRFLIELCAFVFLYAALYENFAVMMGWYRYGRSLVMVGNVPLTVPVVEYLVVYAGLRLAERMKIPFWTRPLFVGFLAMLFDFSLDPVAMRQIFATAEGTIGRWWWFPGPQDAAIYGEPVYNFPGWVLLSGYASAFLMAGRHWFSKAKKKVLVGVLYPVLGMLASLAVLVTPLSMLLLWCGPFLPRGGVGEWIMLGFWFASGLGVSAGLWRGRMKGTLTVRGDWPVLVAFAILPATHVLFCLIGGYFDILWLVGLNAAALVAIVAIAFAGSRKVN